MHGPIMCSQLSMPQFLINLHAVQDNLLANACRWLVISHSLSMLVFASRPEILSVHAYMLYCGWHQIH